MKTSVFVKLSTILLLVVFALSATGCSDSGDSKSDDNGVKTVKVVAPAAEATTSTDGVYTVSIDYTANATVNVVVETKDSKASVSPAAIVAKVVAGGTQDTPFTVKSESGKEKTYKITITMKENPDKTKAATVTAKIAAIGTVTLGSAAAITDARTAYDALTPAQKAFVTTEATLVAAETELKKLQDAKAKEEADIAAAAKATAAIAAIGTVTDKSGDAIKAARKAYDDLTADQKKLVTTLPTLTTAETTFADIQKAADDKDKADATTALIAKIGTVTKDSKAAIDAARASYDKLTADQKLLVTVKTLTDAEAAYAKIVVEETNKAAAAETDALIGAIGTVTEDSKAAIDKAQAAYDKLTADQKLLVTLSKTLTDAKTAFDAIIKVTVDAVAAAKTALTVPAEVAGNITLPATSGDVAIAWASNNAAIGTDGKVTVGEADVTVKLTATLTLKSVTDTKEFTVVVKAKPATKEVASFTNRKAHAILPSIFDTVDIAAGTIAATVDAVEFWSEDGKIKYDTVKVVSGAFDKTSIKVDATALKTKAISLAAGKEVVTETIALPIKDVAGAVKFSNRKAHALLPIFDVVDVTAGVLPADAATVEFYSEDGSLKWDTTAVADGKLAKTSVMIDSTASRTKLVIKTAAGVVIAIDPSVLVLPIK